MELGAAPRARCTLVTRELRGEPLHLAQLFWFGGASISLCAARAAPGHLKPPSFCRGMPLYAAAAPTTSAAACTSTACPAASSPPTSRRSTCTRCTAAATSAPDAEGLVLPLHVQWHDSGCLHRLRRGRCRMPCLPCAVCPPPFVFTCHRPQCLQARDRPLVHALPVLPGRVPHHGAQHAARKRLHSGPQALLLKGGNSAVRWGLSCV